VVMTETVYDWSLIRLVQLLMKEPQLDLCNLDSSLYMLLHNCARQV